MSFASVESAIQTSKSHLSQLDATSPTTLEVQQYLVTSVVVLLVAEFEYALQGMFGERAEKSKDVELIAFSKHNLTRRFRNPDIGKINEALGYFSAAYEAGFSTQILNSSIHLAWDNIIRARHEAAHGRVPSNMTIMELEKSCEEARKLFDVLRAALGL